MPGNRLDSSQDGPPKPETQSYPLHKLRTNAITGWQFDETVLAIVHPILHHGRNTLGARGRVDWFVIILNRDTIQRRISPELSQRYFGDSHGSEYKLAVVAVGKTSQLLYSSDPGFGIPELSRSDSIMNIFGPPPESTEGSFLQIVSLRAEEWRSFSGPVWFPVFQLDPDTHQWMLFLQRRTLPVEASIAKVWQANFFTGAGALLLLAVSMLLVVVASQRERALATMQMDFLASISHELRTPLAAILSAGQNLTGGFARDRSRYGPLITAQARQLIGLVDRILLFASIRHGNKKYQLIGSLNN